MLKGILLVFFGACSFGILSTFVKLAYHEGYTLGDVTGAQAFFGAVILWVLFFFQSRTATYKAKVLPAKTPWWLMIISGACTGLVSIFYYQCVKLVPNSVAIILLMQFIWISILLEYLIFKKKPTGLQLLAILLVLGGTVLASGMAETSIKSMDLKGIGFGLLAAISYAGFLLLSGRIGNEYAPLQKSALMITGACILIFIIFPPVFLFNGALNGSLLKWGLIISVFGTVIPPLFYAEGVPRIGTAISSILSAAELPVAVMMAGFVLQEQVSFLRWVGVVVILSAMVLPNLKYLKRD
ncbi:MULTISPECIES: EamA family transporter [unclassified Pedobacter]|uniref:EamA family transporter n=1 Tax=unclassified Pedobacter TaxID=2628915 RepID=UPI00141FB23E|nr:MULTISPECIES: DMT family transporter [unclassified Pedobacter]NII85130.1 drug/metabolite transporter (DMT)-like permease [Pedobacter sp. SG908]NMN37962.1 drug/metabolite transporter (DMT)-like permease [Pedobacter sp. SG918]